MERRQHFGRRASPLSEAPRAVARPAPSVPIVDKTAEELRAAAVMLDVRGADLDHEVQDWKAMRKLKKRSFREPWRSFSIAAGIVFGAGALILPPAVANITNYLTMGLFAVSVIAGWRRPRG